MKKTITFFLTVMVTLSLFTTLASAEGNDSHPLAVDENGLCVTGDEFSSMFYDALKGSFTEYQEESKENKNYDFPIGLTQIQNGIDSTYYVDLNNGTTFQMICGVLDNQGTVTPAKPTDIVQNVTLWGFINEQDDMGWFQGFAVNMVYLTQPGTVSTAAEIMLDLTGDNFGKYAKYGPVEYKFDYYPESYEGKDAVYFTVRNVLDSSQQIGEWTKSDIIQMSNYMNEGLVYQTGKWILEQGVFDDIKNKPLHLEAYNLVSEENATISQETPAYITGDGLWIVFCAADEKAPSIKKVYVTGGSEQTLIEQKDLQIGGSIFSMQVYDGYIYFSVNDESNPPIKGQFLRADMDGKNITTIIDKAVYYPYIIDNKIYYQDDADKNRLHVCNLDGSDDQVFIDDQCYQYIYDGISFYYTSYDGVVEFDDNGMIANYSDITHVLKKYTPDEGVEVFNNVHPFSIAYNGETLLFTNELDEYRLYSYDISTRTVDPLYFADYLYFLNFFDEKRIYAWDCNDCGEIEDFILATTDGSTFISLLSE